MKVENAKLYHRLIGDLYLQRGIKYGEKFPENGLVVLDDDAVIAAGFIQIIEGNYGMITGYITDNFYSPKIRNEALNHLNKSIIELSEKLNINRLMLFSTESTIIHRAAKFGFEIRPDVMMVRGDTKFGFEVRPEVIMVRGD